MTSQTGSPQPAPATEGEHEHQARMAQGWQQVRSGLHQVRSGGSILLTALAAEGIRLALERGTEVAVLAGSRWVRRLLGRFRGSG